MRRVFAVSLVLALTVLIVGCGASTATNTTSAPAAAVTTAAPTTTTAPPTTTTTMATTTTEETTTTTEEVTTTTEEVTTTTEEVTTTTTVLELKFGTTAGVNGQRITVSKPYRDTGSVYTINGKVDKTVKVIVAKVVMENTGDTVLSYDADEFVLYDTSDVDWTGEAGYAGARLRGLNSGDVQPGKSVNGYVYFVVPVKTAVKSIACSAMSPPDASDWGDVCAIWYN
jgi:Domain of unknown function (DUF4352)